MPEPRLVELIDSVAEGADVNWEEATGAAESDQERHLIDNLRTVADIAQLHRVFASAPDDGTMQTLDVRGWGDLDVIERLGGGAFGDVYLAREVRLNRLVALKVLAQSVTAQAPLAAQLLEEARILARVRHPNVVGVFGAAVHKGRAGFWMEFVAGDTLEDRLASEGPLGAEEAASVGRQVCRALAAVHNAGLIHRDVKARNIMRERGGRIVLMDFGAGIPIERPGLVDSVRVGTPMYLAPEILSGAVAGVQSDVYAVGVLLYHLVSGKFPHAATTVEELQRSHATGAPVPLQTLRPDLPAPLIQVIERALAPVEVRFQSAGEMAAGLERVIVEPPRAWTLRRAHWIGGLAVAASIAAGVAVWPVIEPVRPVITADAFAVTSFVNRTHDPALDVLAAGLARDVQRQLRRMRVPVRSGVASVAAPVQEASLIAQQQGADAVIAASLGRDRSGRFALSVQILSAGGSSMWTREYGATEFEMGSLPGRVALDVAGAIGVVPPPGTGSLPIQGEAYTAYLRGRAAAETRDAPSLLRSVAYFKEAIRLVPDHAEPWAGLADSYIALGVPTFGAFSPRDARRLANDAAFNAVKLDPQSVEAHTSLAFIAYFHDWDWETAEKRFRQAIELDPQYALAHEWYADYLNAMGRHAEGLAQAETAVSLDRLSLLYHRDIGWHYFFQRRYDEAIEHLQRTLDQDPNYTPARTLRGRALIMAGRFDEGLAELRRAAPSLPRPAALLFVAQGEAAAGARKDAERHLAEALALESTTYVSPTYVALVYAALGEPDQTLAWLRRGYESQDTTMVNISQDPRLDPVRTHPHFQALLRQMKFPGAMSAPGR